MSDAQSGEVDQDEPDVRFEWPILKRVFAYFLPYWKRSLVVVACIAAAAGLDLVPAYVVRRLIDEAFHPGHGFSLVVLLVAAAVGAAVAAGTLRVAQFYMSTLISQKIMYDLRNQTFAHLLRQPLAFFTNTRTGDVMSRLSNDVNGVENVVSDTIFNLVTNLIIVLSTIGLMFAWSWQLALLAVAVVPAFVIPTVRVGLATFDARDETQGKLAELTAYMQDVLGISGIMLVKAFVKQCTELARFELLNRQLRDLNVRQAMMGRWLFMMIGVVDVAGPALMFLLGGYLVVTGSVSIGLVVTFATILLGRLYHPAAVLATTHITMVGSLALFQRLFEYLDLPVDITDRAGSLPLKAARGRVSFEDVTFAYQPGQRPALCGVSFEIEPGQLVALVGPSGAGKTTATCLVPRFYDPQEGRVRVDGHDIRDLTLESLGGQVGMVFQDTFLFHASVRENLLYAQPLATQEEVVAAARAAQIHDVIESLPDGYETMVGERGHRLSGGERQRIALARVILKDPRILILDEATSNLDSESERLIQAALQPLFRGRTSLVIAHRLSTVLAADLILVFDRGRVVERGSHFELLEREGLYAHLYRQQFLAEERLRPRQAEPL